MTILACGLTVTLLLSLLMDEFRAAVWQMTKVIVCALGLPFAVLVGFYRGLFTVQTNPKNWY